MRPRTLRYHRGVRLFLSIVLTAAMAGAAVVDRIAATVNDVAIPESEVKRAMAVSAMRPEPGEDPGAYRARVLDALIDEKLQYDDALRFGPPVPDAAEIEAAMKKLRDRIAAEGKDPAAEFAAAGVTNAEVRASVERQLVVQRYLQERFRPIAFADEERAREEYEKRYVPEQRAAGLSPAPFETLAEQMRTRSQQRVFTEEVEKWRKELREKARVAVYRIPVPVPLDRTPVILTAPPPVTPTPIPNP